MSQHGMSIERTLDLATQHFQAGRLAEGEELCRSILETKPNEHRALRLLGGIAYLSGRLDQAEQWIQRAVAIEPNVAEYHDNLSAVWNGQARYRDAEQAARQALSIEPRFPQAENNLGLALKGQGRLDQAIHAFQRAIALSPNYFKAHNNLGNALRMAGLFQEAALACQQALALNPNSPEAAVNLGNALKGLNRFDEAVQAYQRALAIKPAFAEAEYNLGTSLETLGRLEESVEAHERALKINPDYAEAANNLGIALKSQGRQDEAIAAYQRALSVNPNYVKAHTNLLMALQCRPGTNLSELATAHADWDDRHATPLKSTWQPFHNSRDPERRLRIGFVSADLGRHPVGYFLIGAFEALDPEHFQTICYSDRPEKDDFTDRFVRAADTWRDVRRMSDQQLAGQIRADGIDILFDLTGHTGNHRLLVFARKPAPIQVSWIGYAGTTGMAAMDYLLADRFQIPESFDTHYRETVIRLADGHVSYEPPAVAPEVGPLPATKHGHVTFGSFNKPDKTAPQVVEVWSEILRRVPESRLIMKYKGLDDEATRGRYIDRFSKQGVAADRLDFRGWSSHADMLAEYNQFDLALDPFPFSGGVTSCEALWMGVPVVTCPGETFASRQTFSFLSNIGLTDTIAADLQDYVGLAVRLTNDLSQLARRRAELRDRMARSPLCHHQRFAENLSQELRTIWRGWCGRQNSE